MDLHLLGDEGPFDGAVASLSLHHVHDLGVAVERVRSLLRSGGPFMVREFAWNLVDVSEERRLIEAGVIRAVGFLYVGVA